MSRQHPGSHKRSQHTNKRKFRQLEDEITDLDIALSGEKQITVVSAAVAYRA